MAKSKRGKKLPKLKKKIRAPGGEGKHPRDERWEAFIFEYTKDFNATRAYVEAFKATNRDTAKTEGCKLLTNPYVKARVRDLVAERKARLLIQGDELLLKIQEQAIADPRRLFNPETGEVLPVDQWPDDLAGAIASFECREVRHPFTGEITGYVKKVKFWDKPKSQEMLGKNQKLFGDDGGNKVNVTVVTADKEQIKAIMKELQDEC